MDQDQKMTVSDSLDLHTFRPEELESLIPEYIHACLEKKLCQIRIIHGKGTENLRRSVYCLLDCNDHVANYQLADDRSGWGATIVELSD